MKVALRFNVKMDSDNLREQIRKGLIEEHGLTSINLLRLDEKIEETLGHLSRWISSRNNVIVAVDIENAQIKVDFNKEDK
jgi:hypothetical protein